MNNAALITGCAKRIGKVIAIELAKKGYDIAIHYNNSKTEAEILQKEIINHYSVKAEIFQADLLNINEVFKLLESVKIKFKNLNVLINNASIFYVKSFLESTTKDFDDNFNIHVKAPYFLIQQFANKVKKGNVINIIDKNISRYDTVYFPYLISKKSLVNLTQMLALELAPMIRINAICPGFVIANEIHGNSKNYEKNLLPKIPLKKKPQVEDVAKTVVFILESDFMTGEVIFVDCGSRLNNAG